MYGTGQTSELSTVSDRITTGIPVLSIRSARTEVTSDSSNRFSPLLYTFRCANHIVVGPGAVSAHLRHDDRRLAFCSRARRR